MNMYEDFTRCECGHPYLIKDERVLATYKKGKNQETVDFHELPNRGETRYLCAECKRTIFVKRE